MATLRVQKSIWDSTEFVVARVYDDGESERISVSRRSALPRDAEFVDAVVSDLDGAIAHARRALQRRRGRFMALLTTIPDYRLNDQGDTFDAEGDGEYNTTVAFRTYVVPES